MTMSHARRLSLLITTALIAFAASCTSPRPTNVLLITIDTLRDDHCSSSGYERPTTPHLEELSRQGARMALAYSPTSTTGPTHASIFTSLYPIAHGVIKNGLSLGPSFTTLAGTLRERGYDTAGVVSSFVLDTKFGYSRGFDFYDDDFDPQETSLPRKKFEGHDVEGGFDQRATTTTRKALEQLERLGGGERPFFLFVHYFDPHAPYDAPESWVERFRAAESDEGSLSATIDAYDAEIAYTDDAVGALLDRLREIGLEDDTLVIVTSDHGEGLMQHGHPTHGVQIYEEAVRVPLIFRLPGRIASGRVFHEPVELLDLAPTILDLLGSAPVDGLHGRNLAQTLAGDAPLDPQRPVHLHRRHYRARMMGEIPVRGQKFGVRLEQWKYIESDDKESKELFDLESDPGERNNVYESNVDVGRSLSERIAAWRLGRGRETSVQQLSPEDIERLRSLGYVE
jgi:arylsulfatase A-like enzyme